MAQWEKLQQLDTAYQQRVHELYDREELPMDVRHYLAPWIEAQEWDRAVLDPAVAMYLYQVLLENMDNQCSRFIQEGKPERILLQCNFRRFKQNFQCYEERPVMLARIIQWFLAKEREILHMAELPDQVEALQVHQSAMETDSQRQVQKRVEEVRSKVQVMDHTLKCLEEQQDEFDFKYQTHLMEGTISQEDQRGLQTMLNRLDQSRRSLLDTLKALLTLTQEVMSVLLEEELMQWRRRQQKACIGAPEDASLETLEQWFTSLAEGMFQVREFLAKLEELSGKVTYDRDPVITTKPQLQTLADNILITLLKSAFVVETQPSIPQGKGPLVLRTNVQFSVKTRFLVKIPELNHSMQVAVTMDKDAPQVKGYRRFNVLGTSSKAMNVTESMQGGMVADFRHLTLKEQKAGGGGKGISDLSVTEELHVIHFETQFTLHGLSVKLETSSLPVVVISNASQQQSAYASVLWFNMLCQDNKNVLFFTNTSPAPWPQVGEMLSWQFLSAASRGLDTDQLDTIAHKLFGKQQSYDNCTISWNRFSKENVSDNGFSLWVWLDGILTLVKTYLADIWSDGSVVGFISKARERNLLKKKMDGTFLLRFSESIRDGGITFSWVETDLKGKRDVRSVQPFSKQDMAQIPFVEIIRNFQLMEAGNVPECPLKYLYPDTPKDQAFGKYYNEKTGEESPYFKYIKTKLMFVSKESGSEGKLSQPMSNQCLQHCDEVTAAVEPLATGGSIDPLPNGDNMGHLPTEISMEPLANDNLGTLANCNFETLASDIVSSGDSIGQLFLRDNGEQALLGTETPDPDDDLLQKFLSDPNMLQDMGFTGDNSFSGDNSLPGIFTDENSLPAYLTELSTA
ncbi:signal transducer and activator of transcription 2 isoform X1 [Engraulis encrasicolus]|uniref:signal transducer and activator of transcription 2 isoform X1 n=1 Tax=Engraulis encrasicolus TaxID=184585 RepID=UPI002FD00B5F